MKTYEVVIIGAGVSGLYLSKLLENKGIDFITLEKREALGTYGPRIISLETLEKLKLPKKKLIKSIKKINFYSPNETKISKTGNKTRGYIVNLKDIEEFLFNSIKSKDRILLNKNVVDFDIEKKIVRLFDGSELKFKAVIFATGVLGVKFRAKLGISNPRNVFCYAAEIKANDEITTVLNNELAPGFYGWIIPLKDGTIEIGYGAEELNIRDRKEIERRLHTLAHIKKYRFRKKLRINGGFIPTGMINKKSNKEWIIIGDAAGGEPMLGGSIHKCLDEASMAAETIEEFLKLQVHNLEKYERMWSNSLEADLKSQQKVRSLLDSAKNEDFDNVFKGLEGKEIEGEGLINDLFRNIMINLNNLNGRK